MLYLEINNILNKREYDKLLSYGKFDLRLFNDVFKNINSDKIMIHIIDNSIDLEIVRPCNGWKLIHYLIYTKMKLETLKYIINKNIDLKHESAGHNNPLCLSCQLSKDYEIIEFLIEKYKILNIDCCPNKLIKSLDINCYLTEKEKESLKEKIIKMNIAS